MLSLSRPLNLSPFLLTITMLTNYFKFIAFIWFLNQYALQISTASVVSTGDFNKDFFVSWSPSHVNTSADGLSRSLKLDQESGAAFDSNQIDELDFEFLGNVSGQPYILQTNIFADGFDDREERIYLWFDPTADFHTYSVLWNLHQIVFMVDNKPIRTYRNHADKGVAYPRWQPMSIKASLWNGDSWATRGGKDKTDWSKAPFIASFRNYKIDACVWNGNPRFCRADSSDNWWNQERYSSLDRDQKRWFKWVRKYHMIYDYCLDNQRFQNNLPKECSLPKY
ncbi:hypothetical protein Pint_33601 [Pistacia integerrima]|uniref:Uncharacterized protein n=1 Tax=Pistacia integerrima TaxID=434235 RepID=A0ACC0X4F6_9ROSI|nr:hypothetical protein Pint_33601 [Pistacia integerrima]